MNSPTKNPKIILPLSLAAWQTNDFKPTFIKEVEALHGHDLPLQQALRWSSYALAEDFKILVMASRETDTVIEVKTGVFFKGMIPGCSCANDPTPIGEQTEYSEMLFHIDKQNAETTVVIVED